MGEDSSHHPLLLVPLLEQQNRVLAAQWDVPWNQALPAQRDIRNVLGSFACGWWQWLDSLQWEQDQKKSELERRPCDASVTVKMDNS
ncbi:hypothetical protein Nmel_018883 [Mimus melanotis]